MSSPQAILAHLLVGREELVREVVRLTTAISELDAVIGRVGGPGATEGLPAPAAVPTPGIAPAAPVQVETPAPAPEPSPATPEPVVAATSRPRTPPRKVSRKAPAKKVPAKKAAAKKTAARRGTDRAKAGGGQKSIRVHVLEMLAAENRDWGLAEIIDRIHGAGIEAHDDAVRSITIKLMKDGRVERVGRGRYRLARRSRAAAKSPAPAPTTPAAAAPVLDTTSNATDPAAPAVPDAPVAPVAPEPHPDADSAPVAASAPAADADEHTVTRDGATPGDVASAPVPDAAVRSDAGSYTPPLNLAEPWQSRE